MDDSNPDATAPTPATMPLWRVRFNFAEYGFSLFVRAEHAGKAIQCAKNEVDFQIDTGPYRVWAETVDDRRCKVFQA